jgi:hypothetical protein
MSNKPTRCCAGNCKADELLTALITNVMANMQTALDGVERMQEITAKLKRHADELSVN